MKKLNLTNTLENITINEELAKYNDPTKNWFVSSTQDKANEIIAKTKETIEKLMKQK